MTYATQTDMTDRYGETELIQLTDRTGAGVINVTVLNQALADADAEIDAYLAGRYTIGEDSVPLVLKRAACDIARCNLYSDAAPDLIVTRRKEAVRLLENIAKGTVNLGLDSAGATAPSADTVQFVTGGKVFKRETNAGCDE